MRRRRVRSGRNGGRKGGEELKKDKERGRKGEEEKTIYRRKERQVIITRLQENI